MLNIVDSKATIPQLTSRGTIKKMHLH